MVPESADGKDPSSSPSHGAEEDLELYKTNISTPMESEYSVLSPPVDADDDTTLFSKTSSKSSQLEEHDQPDYATYSPDYFNTWKGEVRAVTQTQTGALENSTKSELKALLALLAKDITLRTHNTDGAVSMGSPTSMQQILSMHETDNAEPYARSYVTVAGGCVEAAPTLPGRHSFR
jgi:hypothetical protein